MTWKFFSSSGELHSEPIIGSLYNGFSNDGNCYRGQVEQIFENGDILMRWIDYGNLERVPRANVKELDSKYQEPISAFAKKMFMPIRALDIDAEYEIRELIDANWNNEKSMSIIDFRKSYFIGDVIMNGNSFYAPLESTKRVQRLSIEQLEDLMTKVVEPTPVSMMEEIKEKTPNVDVKHPEQTLELRSAEDSRETSQNHVTQIEDNSMTLCSTQITPSEPMDITANSLSKSSANTSSKLLNIAYITHVDHPNQFYMQLNDDSDALHSLTQSLQIVAPALPPLSNFRAGDWCICQFSVDEQWYRAKIIDTDGDITSIRFLDFGNTDTITDNALLKTCESFKGTKPLAMQCSLPIEPRGSHEWNVAACKKLVSLQETETPLKYELISQDNDINYVKLLVGGRDIVKELIFEEYANQLEIIETNEKGFISHITNLDDFCLQIASDMEVLNLIEGHLNGADKFEFLKHPEVGKVCAALFRDDNSYYRAQIIDAKVDENGILVEFIDFGNRGRSNDLRVLNPDIEKMPHLRRRCALKLPDDIQSWSPEAAMKFDEIADSGRTEFTIKFTKPGRCATVELFNGNENVAQLLSQYCEKKQASVIVVDDHENTIEKPAPVERNVNLERLTGGVCEGYLSHINSFKDFYIQLDESTEQLKAMVANLQGAYNFDKLDLVQVPIGSIVAALYPEDGAYYRAKVINTNENAAAVLFIDYGNQCETNDVRKLPEVLKQIGALAIQCTLPNSIESHLNDSDREQFLNLSVSESDTTFHLEFENNNTTPVTVHIYLGNQAITEFLRNPNSSGHQVYNDALDVIIEDAVNNST